MSATCQLCGRRALSYGIALAQSISRLFVLRSIKYTQTAWRTMFLSSRKPSRLRSIHLHQEQRSLSLFQPPLKDLQPTLPFRLFLMCRLILRLVLTRCRIPSDVSLCPKQLCLLRLDLPNILLRITLRILGAISVGWPMSGSSHTPGRANAKMLSWTNSQCPCKSFPVTVSLRPNLRTMLPS